MEENQNTEKTTTIKEDYRYPACEKSSFWRTLLNGLLIFLGAYCAFYVVSDWHFKRMIMPPVAKMDRAFKREMRDFDKMLKFEHGMAKQISHVIHLEQDNDAYRIMIDLRAFDNNENNVKIDTNGNTLTINGQSIKKTKRQEQISEFQQSYLFGDNVNLREMTKETKGNYYIITIPISTEIED